jgi:hypothetical protein
MTLSSLSAVTLASLDDQLIRKAICVLEQRLFQRGPELTSPDRR